MVPPIFDSGRPYKLVNVKYDTQAADLIDANPSGHIDGYHLNDDSKNQSWYILAGPNLFTFENAAATSTFAYVHSQLIGAELFGSFATQWDLIPVDASQLIFQIATKDRNLVWVLPRGEDYTHIVLGLASESSGLDAQWKFIPA